MEIITKTDKPVLVTGASGYLATWIIKLLLEQGYKVRGTVRSLANKDKYAKLLALQHSDTHLQLVQANLNSEAGWDAAVQGCDYVVHTASPLPVPFPENEMEMIEPAIQGTRFVVKAAIKNKAKRLVATGSCITITGNMPSGSYSDDDKTDVSKISHYPKSKLLAQEALWDLWKVQSGQHKTEMVVVMPSLLFGPTVDETNGDMTYSQQVMATFLDGSYPGIPSPDIEHRTVDVRDVASAHVRALFAANADGKRIAITNEVVSVGKIFSIIKDRFPEIRFSEKPATAENLNATGNMYLKLYSRNMGKKYEIDNSRSKALLGMEYIPFEQSLVDMTNQMRRKNCVKFST